MEYIYIYILMSVHINRIGTLLKQYNIDKCEWRDIMDDNRIPIEIRRYLNGNRYLFVEKILNNISNINKKNLITYPTGTLNLNSDKDIQILLNIDNNININLLNVVIRKILIIIKKNYNIYNCKKIYKLLDTNFYPPTLFNFINNNSLGNKYIKISNKGILNNNNKYKLCIFVPQLSNDIIIKKFIDMEQKNLNKTKKSKNIEIYYDKYINNISKFMINLIYCYKGKLILTDEEFNNNLFSIIKYNNIGPDMYYTISTIIFVVWHMQLNNKLSQQQMRIFGTISYLENKKLYEKTKKEKYKDRYLYAKKLYDKSLLTDK